MNESLFQRGWQLFLEDEPDNLDRRAVLADWLDEQGDSEAASCLRWMVSANRLPNKCTITGTYDWWRYLAHRIGSGWTGETEDHFPHAGLPAALYKIVYDLRGYTSVDNFIPSDTRLEAEILLVTGWRLAVEANGGASPIGDP